MKNTHSTRWTLAYALLGCLGLGFVVHGPNATANVAADKRAAFETVRTTLQKTVQAEASALIAATGATGLRKPAAAFLRLGTKSTDEIARRLTETVLKDVLPDGELSDTLGVDITKWSELSDDPSYKILRSHAIHQSVLQMEELTKKMPGGEASVRFTTQTCGEDQRLHGLLTEYASYDYETQTVEFCSRFLPKSGDWQSWQTTLTAQPKATLDASLPKKKSAADTSEESQDDFPNQSPNKVTKQITETILAVAPDETIVSDRTPASIPKALNGKTRAATRTALPVRKSRLPSSVADGFEFRMQYGKLISTFWIIKRGTHYDLMFANSAGSKTTIGIPVEGFSYLQSTAESVPNDPTDLRKCKEASMQIHVVADGHAERTVSACVKDKTKAAAELRSLGNMLSMAVR